jgi:hypothetical protein
MAGRGPAPKPGSARQRKGSKSAVALVADPDIEIPELPDRDIDWHYQTIEWWEDVWASPMAPEYDDSDIHSLYIMAVCVDDFWSARNPTERQKASAEVRLHSQRLGLSPIDRLRLRWEIQKVEDGAARAAKRQAENRAISVAGDDDDPRADLHSA